MSAEGFAILRFAADWSGPWHPSPYRQWFFLLSGSLTVTVGDGTEQSFCTGDVILIDSSGGFIATDADPIHSDIVMVSLARPDA
jgi:quercetin dioxygenase-like cupin family protein